MEYLLPLKNLFETHANPLASAGAKAYMHVISDFYGLGSPMRRQVLKEFISTAGYPAPQQLWELVHFAWDQPQREWQYCAMEIVTRFAAKGDEKILPLAEFMITTKSWWDTVDYLAPNINGVILKKRPELIAPVIENWLQSGNLWLQRSCLLFQLRYKKDTDEALLFGLCERLSAHKDFFIRKAIGWSLREYSKTKPRAVLEFANTHALSPLSYKEAIRRIKF